jgi:hypothetical protein
MGVLYINKADLCYVSSVCINDGNSKQTIANEKEGE